MKFRNKLLLLAGATGAAILFANTLMNETVTGDIIIPDGFTVTAHTGCEKTKDNSLDAITIGFGYGADIVEFDLNFNNEGVAVLSHDEPKGKEHTLEEAFELVAGYNNLLVNVDVKNTKDLRQVKELAEKYNLSERIFFTGITEADVEAVKAQTPDISYYLNKDLDKSRIEDIVYIEELIALVKNLGARGLNIKFSTCSSLMVDMFHKEGLEISVWTVNKKSDMKKVLTLGCDNITTRNVSDLLAMLNPVN